jgi:hypothetical protein
MIQNCFHVEPICVRLCRDFFSTLSETFHNLSNKSSDSDSYILHSDSGFRRQSTILCEMSSIIMREFLPRAV